MIDAPEGPGDAAADGRGPSSPDAPHGGASEGMWGGRFRAPLHPDLRAFTNSLPFDRRLARHDLVASLAHARSLLESGAVAPDDAAALLEGLSGMLEDLEAGRLEVEGPDEDVHGWLERTLGERIGAERAGRLQTGRSRNDQTGAALRLWLRDRLPAVMEALLAPVDTWLGQAAAHRESWMPGYTHLQRAQPVSLAHHLLAHVWTLLADAERLVSVHEEAGVSPLGAAALAGSSHPIDPGRTAALLGFRRPYPNSLWAVADRDYVASATFAAALLMVHLSRWAEEIVLWTSSEFAFAELADAAAQGSSLMPQKKNPEAAELVRGKAGRTIGDLVALLTTQKGLPFAYTSDLQEDKEPLFDALDTAEASLRATAAVAGALEFRTERLREALETGHLAATDLADALVRAGKPFRDAHRQVGRAVLEAERRGCDLAELPTDVLRECCPALGEDVSGVLDPASAVRSRAGEGGPAPERVTEQIERATERRDALRDWIGGLKPPPVYRAHREGRLLDDALA